MNEGTRPHTLHLAIDKHGWLTWTLDCPYSATEVEDIPGRPCNLLGQNETPCPDSDADPEGFDDWSPWVKIPGCFAKRYLEESGEWDDVVCIDQTDPSFPVEVDVDVEGSEDDAYVRAVVPWPYDTEGRALIHVTPDNEETA